MTEFLGKGIQVQDRTRVLLLTTLRLAIYETQPTLNGAIKVMLHMYSQKKHISLISHVGICDISHDKFLAASPITTIPKKDLMPFLPPQSLNKGKVSQ
jgi:hypothetical protein